MERLGHEKKTSDRVGKRLADGAIRRFQPDAAPAVDENSAAPIEARSVPTSLFIWPADRFRCE